MPTGKDFSPETWQEIYEARARFQAFVDKVQPYPAYPDQQGETPVVATPYFRPRPVDAEIDQLKSKVNNFQTKLNEHIDAGKKAAKERAEKKSKPIKGV